MAQIAGPAKKQYKHIPAGNYTVPAALLNLLAADTEITFISVNRKIASFGNSTPPAAAYDFMPQTIGASSLPLSTGANVPSSPSWTAASTTDKHADFGYCANATCSSTTNNPMVAISVKTLLSQQTGANALPGTVGPTQSRILYEENFVSTSNTIADEYGHGTHIAGLIAGNGSTTSNLTNPVQGVAPSANLVIMKALDVNGQSTVATVISAIDRVIQLKQLGVNIGVLNLSLGAPIMDSYTNDPLCQAAEAGWKAGITVVTAAGNYGRDNSSGRLGYGTITSPGNDPLVITVGSMKTQQTASPGDDTIASYSSKGPTSIDHVIKPDFVAPGNLVYATLDNGSSDTLASQAPTNVVLNGYLGITPPPKSNYLILSGTSMASGVTSGAVAALLSAEVRL